jgi:hypothetical protein
MMMMMMTSPFPIKSGIRSPPKSESSAPDTTNGLKNSCADVKRDDDDGGPSTSPIKTYLTIFGIQSPYCFPLNANLLQNLQSEVVRILFLTVFCPIRKAENGGQYVSFTH